MTQPAITWRDVVTDLVAGVALVLSAVALIVQYILWRNSGGRVRVEGDVGFLTMLGGTRGTENQRQQPRPRKRPDRVLVGRARRRQ